jgi:hypothetical protein
VLEQVAHRVQAAFFVCKPVPASYTKKSFKIREGNGYPY